MKNQIINEILKEAYYGEEKGAATPWGRAQQTYPIIRGVNWYSTAGHGGMSVARGTALKFLTTQARELGMLHGNSYWYEEDNAWVIPFYENPHWQEAFVKAGGGGKVYSKEELKTMVERDYPKYFDSEFVEKTVNKHNKPKLEPND